MGALNTSAVQAELAPSWKQEVNLRLAAHKSRKGMSSAEAVLPEVHPGNQRAAAVARVAARFAKVPSYSQMLAEEAREAVRVAGSAARAAQEAHVAAESLLAGLEAKAAKEEMAWLSEVSEDGFAEWNPPSAVPSTPQGANPLTSPVKENRDSRELGIRWDADLPVRAEAAVLNEPQQPSTAAMTAQEWWELEGRHITAAGGADVVEVELPIHGNLIHFPREIIAARKMRPRRIEGSSLDVADAESQLSIFEVDPGTISTEPAAAATFEQAATWTAPEWSGIELDAEVHSEAAAAHVFDAPVSALPEVEAAPLNLRVMAAVVDFSIVGGAYVGAAWVASSILHVFPSMRAMEIGSTLALLLLGAAYMTVFFTLASATPGMRYAGLALCTFDDQLPTKEQRYHRLLAMLVSVVPAGLGVAWSIFDEQHLSWHDRLSGTYLRTGL
jgi:uncharacterized RDD family membrane protein YckC